MDAWTIDTTLLHGWGRLRPHGVLHTNRSFWIQFSVSSFRMTMWLARDPHKIPSCQLGPFYGSARPSDRAPGILCGGASEASENSRDQNRDISCCNRGPGVHLTQFLGYTNLNIRPFNPDHEYLSTTYTYQPRRTFVPKVHFARVLEKSSIFD